MADHLQSKSSTDFADYSEWQEYVRQTVPPEEMAYTMALGQTTRFLRFYELRKEAFPDYFSAELARIEEFQGPDKTEVLEDLNARIFSDMARFLFVSLSGGASQREDCDHQTPREIIETLTVYLTKHNPHFALWSVYTKQAAQQSQSSSFGEFVSMSTGSTPEDTDS